MKKEFLTINDKVGQLLLAQKISLGVAHSHFGSASDTPQQIESLLRILGPEDEMGSGTSCRLSAMIDDSLSVNYVLSQLRWTHAIRPT